MAPKDSGFSKQAIARYYNDLHFRMNIYNKAKKDMDVHLASEFNVFDYINPDENKLSDIMADLLNPQGKHGQTTTFLEAFVALLKMDDFPYELATCKIAREISTAYIVNNQRRIDITLNFANAFKIAIENKPWDSEQENQLKDYQKHLERKFGRNYCIVYISGDGSPPESLEKTLKEELKREGRLVVLNYQDDMKCWLQTCYKECKAEKIRAFIKDFIQYIDSNFENLYEGEEEAGDGE